MIGTVLKHRYEVLEKIGEGNLFTVYKCDDKINNRPVAVKVLLPQYAANTMFAERMMVEAQAMVGISHPNLVEVKDTGCEDGSYYVVVEYIRGVDLKERIRRNAPFMLSSAVDIGMAICDVLDFAHRRGFIHGDLRPGNILVTPEGQVKVSDFWVYEAIASSQSIRTTAMMRSVHYTSPEVAEGNQASPTSDVYSLGVILFEALTGTLPFDGDTPIAIALKHAKDPVPSLRALNPGVPKALETALVKALQKSPEQRFRSAKAMLNELKSVHDALNLSKPLTWSAVTDKNAPVPDPEVAEAEASESAVLSALLKTLAVVVGMIAVVAAVMIGYVWMNPSEVQVPDLIGKDLTTAMSIAKQKNIRLVVKAEEYNDKFPEGQVYFSSPKAGLTIKEGKFVDVWVSKGSKFTQTPSLVKATEEDARQRIVDAGLAIGELSQDYSTEVPAGSIMAQSPASGTRQERGQPVNIVVSLGPKPEETPFTSDTDVNETPAETRSFDVGFEIPSGPRNQTVQIVVVDDNGEHTVYSEIGHPGDEVKQTVEGTGKQVTIRVYIDDKLVSEERK